MLKLFYYILVSVFADTVAEDIEDEAPEFINYT